MPKENDLTLNQWARMYGHPLPVAKGEVPKGFLFGQVFNIPVVIPDASTTAVDITTAASIGAEPMISQFHGTGPNPRILMQIDGCELVIYDEEYATLDVTEKQALVEGVRLQTQIDGTTRNYALGNHIKDTWSERTLAVAADGAQYEGEGPLWLEDPVRVDFERDALTLDFNSITTPNSADGLKGWLRVYGFVVPNSIEDPGGIGFDAFAAQSAAAYRAMRLRGG